MSFFPSLSDDAGGRHNLTFNPKVGRAFLAFSSAVIQNASPPEPSHKDRSAVFVSGLKGNPDFSNTRGRALRDEGDEPLMAFLDAAAKNDPSA